MAPRLPRAWRASTPQYALDVSHTNLRAVAAGFSQFHTRRSVGSTGRCAVGLAHFHSRRSFASMPDRAADLSYTNVRAAAEFSQFHTRRSFESTGRRAVGLAHFYSRRSFASTPDRAADFSQTVVGAGVVGLATARAPHCQPHRSFSSTTRRAVDFTHTVVGAGVVGLATARALQLHSPDNAVLLLERHPGPGAETSSRNSEVVHAGLYYGHSSLKTALCLRGKNALYAYAAARHIPIAQTGKWLVAQTDAQRAALDAVVSFAAEVGDGANDGLDSPSHPPGFRGPAGATTDAIPLRALTPAQCAAAEPDVRAAAGAVESASTGIVDSHALMTALLGDFEDAGGTAAFASDVRRAHYDESAREWELHVAPSQTSGAQTTKDEQSSVVSSATLINSAGLGAIALSNAILPASQHREPAYAKGTYFGYSASRPRPGRLIYPAPVPGHGGLGTHLTLDLGGRVRFGPDVEWVTDPGDVAPRADEARMAAALDDITSYLPGLDRDAVTVDYCGIRPKLRQGASATAGKGFEDFYIRVEEGVPHGAFVNMLGIESPGLTSALAIGDYVRDLLYR